MTIGKYIVLFECFKTCIDVCLDDCICLAIRCTLSAVPPNVLEIMNKDTVVPTEIHVLAFRNPAVRLQQGRSNDEPVPGIRDCCWHGRANQSTSMRPLNRRVFWQDKVSLLS